jgi:hypothetical protein
MVPSEIDGLQVSHLLAPQAPALRDSKQDRVAVGREPAFAAKRSDPFNFIISTVKERLQLMARPVSARCCQLNVSAGIESGRLWSSTWTARALRLSGSSWQLWLAALALWKFTAVERSCTSNLPSPSPKNDSR